MQCASCGALVSVSTGKCDHCGREFAAAAARQLASQPAKYHVRDDGAELSISWSWFSPHVFLLVPFAIAWNAFLFGWYSMASGMPEDFGPMRIVMMLFPMGHVAVGLGLIYGVVCSLANSTTIAVAQGTLRVWHGPVYYPGSQTFEALDIEQIFLAEATPATAESPQPALNLMARLRGNRQVFLVKHLQDRQAAVFLEQTLERFLRIADERVAGEVSVA